MVGFSQLRYSRWQEWVLVCLIVPAVLGILIGGGLMAIVKYPIIVLVVASLVSVAVMIVRSNWQAKASRTATELTPREPVGAGGLTDRR